MITSISFDHMRQLGNTLASIAREKAGIIKPGVPVISGVTEPEPQEVIAEVAREHGCRLVQLGRDFRFQYQGAIDFEYTIAGQEYQIPKVPLAMRGRHQAANAAVALATIAELRHQAWCVSSDAMKLGLSRAALPGRVEVVAGDPLIVLDTAHNPASARALVEAIAELPSIAHRTLIVSISHDKDVPAVVRELVPHFDRIIVTEYQENPRAVPAAQLLGVVRQASAGRKITLEICGTPREAWQLATQTAVSGECVCIAGSFYLAAEMRSFIQAADASEPTGR